MLDKSLFQPTTEVVAKEVELPTGKVNLYFSKLTSTEYQIWRAGLMSANFDERSDVLVWFLTKTLRNKDGSSVDENGEPILTKEQAKTLKSEAFLALLSAAIEVNNSNAGKSLESADSGTS